MEAGGDNSMSFGQRGLCASVVTGVSKKEGKVEANAEYGADMRNF